LISGRTFFVSPYIHKGIEEDWRLLNSNKGDTEGKYR